MSEVLATSESSFTNDEPILRILYADDEEMLRGLFDTVMTEHGYVVDLVENGELALDACTTTHYDLVVLDHQMVGLLGLEVACRLREDYPDLPIVLITGVGDEELAAMALTLGINQYIVKRSNDTYISEVPLVVERLIDQRDTKRKVAAAEQTIRENEARYRELVEMSPDAIVATRQGIISLANKRAREIYGLAEGEELVGTRLLDRVLPDQQMLANRVFQKTAQEKIAFFDVEQTHLRLDGTEIDVEIHGAPVSGLNGAQGIFTIRDISEQNKLRLRVAQLERHNMVGQMTSGVAHEFNNLLQVLASINGFLRKKLDDPELLDHADEAIANGASLTRQMLAYSRKQFLNPQPVDPGNIIGDMMDQVASTMGDDVQVSSAVASGLYEINVDVETFQKSILNLCSNSKQAMPRGGMLRFEMETRTIDQSQEIQDQTLAAGEYIDLKVMDTGSGMHASVVKQAFEPFFTTHDVGQGTGLGLSMVYGFSMQSGGYAGIESAPEQGTTVTLTFPIYKVCAPQKPLIRADIQPIRLVT